MIKKGIARYPQFKCLTLTPKIQKFVILYCDPLLNWNATEAYVMAFESKSRSSARRCASFALKNPKVIKAIKNEKKRRIDLQEELAELIAKLNREEGKL